MCLPSVGTKHIEANVRLTGSGGVYSMILSTWNFEYALQLQSIKTICVPYRRHPIRLLMLFVIPKSIFQPGPLKLIKAMLKSSLHVLLCLSPVWNRNPKGSPTKWATKHSIITYDEIKDRICQK